MSKKKPKITAAGIRRVVQILFLIAFFALLLLTRFEPTSGSTSVGGETVITPALQAPAPILKLFFIFDPLITVVTALTAHEVPIIALFSIVTIVVTMLLGRVFCGWICPMGTIQAIAGRLLRGRKKRRNIGTWSRWQLAKYYILVGLLIPALFGLHFICMFDPLVLLTRSSTTALLPAIQIASKDTSTILYHTDPGIGPLRIDKVVEPTYQFANKYIFGLEGVDHNWVYPGGGLILLIFAAIVALNAFRPRFWCRYICPLGALLGLFSWRPFLKRKVNTETCTHCDLCGMSCHGAAAVGPGEAWKPMECLGCMDCTESCKQESLTFEFSLPKRKDPAIKSVNLSRRGIITAGVSGLTAMAAMRISPQSRGESYNPALIRPPGARPEREFLKRCTSCGLCIKACPTGGLQPTLTEAGLEGLWTPMLVPSIGYCDYMCNLCGQVCPTGAITELTLEEKHATRIGLAAFDVRRCLPYAYGRNCMVCEEHCPIPDKAIYCLDVDVKDRNGQVKTIKRPFVDPTKCTGCGLCENVCPYNDRAAIRVASANESRHPDNQPILGGDSMGYPYG